MVATVVMLTLVHKRLRLQRYREIREYYEEQMKCVFLYFRSFCATILTLNSLRKSLAALHAAAADRYTDEKHRHD